MKVVLDGLEVTMTGGVEETLRGLFLDGPTWDGDLASKAGRCQLERWGFVVRRDGWQTLTEKGLELALAAGLGQEKWYRNNEKRRQVALAKAQADIIKAQADRDVAANWAKTGTPI